MLESIITFFGVMIPEKLYKYRSFNAYTLSLLCEDEVYYAPPSSFNDPLDCNPTIENDLDLVSLKNLYQKMYEKDCKQSIPQKFEFDIKLPNVQEKTIKEYLEETSTHVTNSFFNRYSLKECNAKDETELAQFLINECKTLLDKKMAHWGVLSLAKRWNCPLMWSHYAYNHQGLCIEYDTDENTCNRLSPVDYKRPRSIKVSDLIQSELDGSIKAWHKIVNAYFFTKARDWKYEKEWRCVSVTLGKISAPFRISGIYFGLRCDPAVKKTIYNLLQNQKKPSVRFYQVIDNKKDFFLKKQKLGRKSISSINFAGDFFVRREHGR